MRFGLLLTRSLGLVCLVACTTASPPDEDCIVNGGLCLASSEMAACGTVLPSACASSYTCCATIYGGNLVDGSVPDALNDAPKDVKTSVDTGNDAPKDSPAKGSEPEGSVTDATKDAGSAG